MENGLIFVSLIAVFLVSAIHVASTQTFDAPPVPCTPESGCTDPRLPAGARCQAGFCICLDENGAPKKCSAPQTQPKSAVRNPAVVQTCKNPQDCNLPNEFCNTTRSQCACSDGYVMASKTRQCLPVATTLGSLCDEDQQCQKIMGNTSCIGKQCVCSSGYHFSKNNTCWKTIGFGEHCSNNYECSHTDNAECDKQSSLCGCSKNTTVNSDSTRCLVIAMEIGGECIERAQCTKKFPNTDCIDKKCQCTGNNHYERSSNECQPILKLEKSCYKNLDCHADGVDDGAKICRNNICVCNDSFIRNGDECVRAGASSHMPAIFLTVFSVILLFARS